MQPVVIISKSEIIFLPVQARVPSQLHLAHMQYIVTDPRVHRCGSDKLRQHQFWFWDAGTLKTNNYNRILCNQFVQSSSSVTATGNCNNRKSWVSSRGAAGAAAEGIMSNNSRTEIAVGVGEAAGEPSSNSSVAVPNRQQLWSRWQKLIYCLADFVVNTGNVSDLFDKPSRILITKSLLKENKSGEI